MLVSVISFVVIAMFAYLVIASAGGVDSAISSMNMSSPALGANLSGVMTLNITSVFRNYTDGQADKGNYTNVTVQFRNFSTNNIVSAFVITAVDRAVNQTFYNATINTAISFTGLLDGLYNITLTATNASDLNRTITNNTVINQGKDLITIDNTFPEVRGFNDTDRVNYTFNQNVSVRVTLTNNTGDSRLGTELHKVLFQISYFNTSKNNLSDVSTKNVTGLIANVYNITWNATNNVIEGNHTVTIFVNDTAGNMNNTQNASFLIDLTAPTANLVNLTEDVNVSKSNFTFQWNTTDTWATSMLCQVVVNSNINITDLTVANGTAGGSSTLQSSRTLADGFYNVSVMCNDTVRLQGTSIMRNFTIDTVTPDVQTFYTDRANITTRQAIALNASISNKSGTAIHVVYFQVQNGTSSFNITTAASNTTLFNATLNLTQYNLQNGNNTVTIFANDTAGNLNNSGTFNVLVDTVAPNVVGLQGNLTGVESFNTTKNLPTFQWQVNDSTSERMSCDIYLNRVANTTNVVTSNQTVTNFTVPRSMADGHYNVSIQCNDSLQQQNVSTVRNFTVDTTGPAVTVTCAPSSVSAGDSVSCSCAAADTTTTVVSSSFTDTKPVTTTAGSFTTGTCTATDLLGNSASATGSYSVSGSSSSGSGGGGGGSGGGVSTTIPSQLEMKTWTSILAGEKATVEVKSGDLGVTSISFTVDKTTYGAWVEVKKVATLPTTISAFGDKVYKTLQIAESNVEKVLSGTAVINFKVEKSWLNANNLDKSGVALFHFKDSKWTQLPTTVGEDDGTNVHYTAETTGFSYFVIGKTAQAVAPTTVTGAVTGTTPLQVTQPTTGAVGKTATVPSKSSSSTAVWVVVGLVLVGLLVWVVMALRRRR